MISGEVFAEASQSPGWHALDISPTPAATARKRRRGDHRGMTSRFLRTVLCISAVSLTVACESNNQPGGDDPALERERTLSAGPDGPGGSGLVSEPDELIRGHLEAEFRDRDWYDSLELSIEGETVRLEIDSDDPEAALEACTAVAGFLVSAGATGGTSGGAGEASGGGRAADSAQSGSPGPSNSPTVPLFDVVVTDADGSELASADHGDPQCNS